MALRIPAHLLQRARRLALQSWVSRKDFPSEHHFSSISVFEEQLKKCSPDGQLDPERSRKALALMIGAALDHEGALAAYVAEQETVDLSNEEEWLRVCETAGWCVLQAYERERDG